MQNTTFKSGGIVVFWSIGETCLKKLSDGLNKLAMEKFTPEPRTKFSALREALTQVYPGVDYLVRPLANNAGYEVVDETRCSERNEFRHVATYILDDVYGVTSPEDAARTFQVREQLATFSGLLSPISATRALVDMIAALRGTRIRESGAVYWLPDSSRQMWEQIAQVFEQSGQSRLYTMTVGHDAGMVAAVLAAITNEITSEAAQMSHDICLTGEDALGVRALRSRKILALSLREKVKMYEGLIGAALPTLTASLEQVELAAAAAELQLSAQSAL